MNNDTNALGGGHAHWRPRHLPEQPLPADLSQPAPLRQPPRPSPRPLHRPDASTYIGKHAADFLRANDMHFIPVTQRVGPDGALYVSDWSDQANLATRGSGAVERWQRQQRGASVRISYDGLEAVERRSREGKPRSTRETRGAHRERVGIADGEEGAGGEVVNGQVLNYKLENPDEKNVICVLA